MKTFRIFSASSFTLCIQLFHKDTRRLQSNRVERNVEFVFAPQHRISCDSEITTKEDFDYWRKITEESNLEVYRRIHDESNETEDLTMTKDINSFKYCHVYLSGVL